MITVMSLGAAIALGGGGISLPLLKAGDATREDAAQAAPKYFPMPPAGGGALPFSEAVQLGNTLYVSGQIGISPGNLTPAPGGFEAEASRAMENMKAILERHGSSLDQVLKCTVFLADIKDWPAFNVVYRKYFQTRLPARSALGANGLALGARVEIECIAFVPPAK